MISQTRIQRIKEQGYFNLTNSEISELAFGNRFAYILCTTIMSIGVITASIPILTAMMCVAFASLILPYHPFDYIYNHVIRPIKGMKKLPPRSKQLKFACGVATCWLATTIAFFYFGNAVAGYIMGGMLMVVAGLVSTLDFCIPSIIYNYIFKVKVNPAAHKGDHPLIKKSKFTNCSPL